MFHVSIGIDPNLFALGPFLLTWHGIISALAIVVAVAVIRREFIRRGLPLAKWEPLVYGTVAGGIIGARLFYVIDHLGYHLRHPLEILMIHKGGLAIYGAVIGGFVAVWIQSRIYRFPFLSVIDAIAPGLVLAQAVGRLGCTINGDTWGAPTTAPFALIYTHPDALLPDELKNVPTHAYPIYDALLNLAIFAVVWRLRKRDLPSGAIFAIFAALYAAGRFAISFMRQERVWFWGLQEAQVIAVAMLIASTVALAVLLRRAPQRLPRTL